MKNKKILALIVLIHFVPLLSRLEAQTTLTLSPDKDAVLHISLKPGSESQIYTNYGTEARFYAEEWTSSGYRFACRSIIDFDLSQIPAGAKIVSAQLSLYADGSNQVSYATTNNSGYKTNACYLERVTEPWTEMGVTYNNQPATTIQNRALLPESQTNNENYTNMNVTALVQDMVNDPAESFGLMLLLLTEGYPYAQMSFCSREDPNAGLRPKLVVTYSTEYSIDKSAWLNYNYIHTITPLQAMDPGTVPSDGARDLLKINEIVDYFDGLGRPVQSISIKGSPAGKDIIQPIVYDQYGREAIKYLPYTADQSISGTIGERIGYNDVLNQQESFYNVLYPSEGLYAKGETKFDSSPLNRIMEQGSPGLPWQPDDPIIRPSEVTDGHTLKYEYTTNTIGTEVKKYKVDGSGTILADGYYDVNQLFVTVAKDEDWTSGNDHTTREYKDKQGQVILKKAYNNGEDLDTYYVYDDFGLLRCVLPPKAIGIVSDGLCYQYKYDGRKRLIEKKIPGKGWEYIVYDKLDRPVLTQDSVLRDSNKWLFTKYDIFGRVAYTGEYTRTTSFTQAQMQDSWDTQNTTAQAQYETKQYPGYELTFYSNSNFPYTNIAILTINHYDDYTTDLGGSFNPITGNILVYGVYPLTKVKGLPTVSKTKVLGTSYWITTVIYYDAKARPIYTYTKNDYLGTTDMVESRLAFIGQVEETTTTHKKTGQADMVIRDVFEYDHHGRLTTLKQAINTQGEEVIAVNTYDESGQLKSKGVGGKTGHERLQTVDYTYNIRGWLKDINNINSLGNDLFAFKINYDTEEMGAGNPAQYNGNLSETLWRTVRDKSGNYTRGYAYQYDALNRVAYSDYGVKTTGSYNLNSGFDMGITTYDKNGNIQGLQRKDSTNNLMDNLTYAYDGGNRLQLVSDATGNTQGFKDGNTVGNDYAYDGNGNLTEDKNKGITNISYNYLNLPQEITFGSNGKIDYIYDAAGTKLKKVVTNGTTITTTEYAEGFEYENNVLLFMQHAEGYTEPNGQGGYDYVYQYKDHLGNIRLSYVDSDGDGLISDAALFSDGFESASGWNSIGALTVNTITSYDNSFKHSGNYSGKIVKSTAGEYYVHSDTWVNINNSTPTQYTFSGWVYSDNPSVDIFLFMMKDGETGYFTNVESVRTYTINQWVYLEKTVTVPANIRKLNIRIDNNGGGTVWFDDIEFKKAGYEIVEENNYYPFGLRHQGYNNTIRGREHKYKYNGKELQDDAVGSSALDWYDYGARFYDPALGRWFVPDPLQQFHSPYNYAGNNPINNIDPSGMYSYNWTTREYENNLGNVVSWNEVQFNNFQEPEKKKTEGKDDKEKIAIDPGHGDHNDKNSQVDPGAVNGADYEKDIALNISNAVEKELEAKGYIITMTRTGDVENAGTKLQWRIDKAAGTDIFVSIHTNSVGTATANGFQVCYKTADANSKSLAQFIQDQNTLFKSRGIRKRSHLYVLNKYTGTAVLVEVGFISNASDLNLMKSNTSEIGKQIATGIINYLSK